MPRGCGGGRPPCCVRGAWGFRRAAGEPSCRWAVARCRVHCCCDGSSGDLHVGWNESCGCAGARGGPAVRTGPARSTSPQVKQRSVAATVVVALSGTVIGSLPRRHEVNPYHRPLPLQGTGQTADCSSDGRRRRMDSPPAPPGGGTDAGIVRQDRRSRSADSARLGRGRPTPARRARVGRPRCQRRRRDLGKSTRAGGARYRGRSTEGRSGRRGVGAPGRRCRGGGVSQRRRPRRCRERRRARPAVLASIVTATSNTASDRTSSSSHTNGPMTAARAKAALLKWAFLWNCAPKNLASPPNFAPLNRASRPNFAWLNSASPANSVPPNPAVPSNCAPSNLASPVNFAPLKRASSPNSTPSNLASPANSAPLKDTLPVRDRSVAGSCSRARSSVSSSSLNTVPR